jgi:glycerophosphoryl diester phosphodiesterase
MLSDAGWTSRDSPVLLQSFEPGSLKYMRSKGSKLRMVQLIDGDSVDLKTGAVTFGVPSDRPYDWTLVGDKRNFDVMVTPAGLAEIKTYADGIGPWKRYIVSIKGKVGADGKVMDVNGDGKINDADATTLEPTTLIADAHRAGLFVHAFTFRNENRRLATDYRGDPKQEYLQYYALGLDGLFTDFTDTALAARAEYLRKLGASN